MSALAGGRYTVESHWNFVLALRRHDFGLDKYDMYEWFNGQYPILSVHTTAEVGALMDRACGERFVRGSDLRDLLMGLLILQFEHGCPDEQLQQTFLQNTDKPPLMKYPHTPRWAPKGIRQWFKEKMAALGGVKWIASR